MRKERQSAREIVEQIMLFWRLNSQDLADALGVSVQCIRDINTEKVKTISPRLRQKIMLTFPDLSPRWLLTGEGTMVKEESAQTNTTTTQGGGITQSASNTRGNVNQSATQANNITGENLARLTRIIETQQEHEGMLLQIIKQLTSNK